jgi:hypothetical protein
VVAVRVTSAEQGCHSQCTHREREWWSNPRRRSRFEDGSDVGVNDNDDVDVNDDGDVDVNDDDDVFFFCLLPACHTEEEMVVPFRTSSPGSGGMEISRYPRSRSQTEK